MTQQISAFTTGELNASIEGFGEFNTRNIEFMGSTDESDFLLRGIEGSRHLIFYFPLFESGHYVLGAGSANKASYEVGGVSFGEIKGGFVDVTVEAGNAVNVYFSFSIEDKAGAVLIRITGSGNFKGRVPWTDNGRTLSNVICGVNDPLQLFPPAFDTPSGGWVGSEFPLYIVAPSPGGTIWETQVMVGSEVVKQTRSGPTMEYYDVRRYWEDLTGWVDAYTSFYMRARYYSTTWSPWGWSENLKMIPKPCEILLPTANTTISPFPLISGKGNPKATVDLCNSDNAAIRYGTAVVDGNGDWKTTPDMAFPVGNFRLIALETINGYSRWSNSVGYTVDPLGLPVITIPKEGESLYCKGSLSGTGVVGARVALHKQGDGHTVYGVANVRDDSTWFAPLDRELPLEPITMTVKQTLGGVNSGWAHPVSFHVVDLFPPSIEVPAPGEQFRYDRELSGRGIPKAIVILYDKRDGEIIYGIATVNELGEWSTPLNRDVPAGPFSITAVHVVPGRTSDYAPVIHFTIIR